MATGGAAADSSGIAEVAVRHDSFVLRRTKGGFGMEVTASGHVVAYSAAGGPSMGVAEEAGVPLGSRCACQV